jgi:hypothetical protein
MPRMDLQTGGSEGLVGETVVVCQCAPTGSFSSCSSLVQRPMTPMAALRPPICTASLDHRSGASSRKHCYIRHKSPIHASVSLTATPSPLPKHGGRERGEHEREGGRTIDQCTSPDAAIWTVPLRPRSTGTSATGAIAAGATSRHDSPAKWILGRAGHAAGARE